MSIADRPIQLQRQQIGSYIRNGTFDRQLLDIEEAVKDRRAQRRAQVMAEVAQVFGPNATIQVPESE